jgi:hypothetical protein
VFIAVCVSESFERGIKVSENNTASERDDLAKRYADKLDTTIVAACISEADFKAGWDARDAEIRVCDEIIIGNLMAENKRLRAALEGLLAWAEKNHEMPNYSEVIAVARETLAEIGKGE